MHTEGPVQTIGSIPMRPMHSISINITKDVEAHGDKGSETGEYSESGYERKLTHVDEEIATVH